MKCWSKRESVERHSGAYVRMVGAATVAPFHGGRGWLGFGSVGQGLVGHGGFGRSGLERYGEAGRGGLGSVRSV